MVEPPISVVFLNPPESVDVEIQNSSVSITHTLGNITFFGILVFICLLQFTGISADESGSRALLADPFVASPFVDGAARLSDDISADVTWICCFVHFLFVLMFGCLVDGFQWCCLS